jgi:hypothetical protein
MSTKSRVEVKGDRQTSNIIDLAVAREARMKTKTPHYRDEVDTHYTHPAFHRYFGRGAPRRRKGKRTSSYGEVCVTVFNEWTGVPFTPDVIEAWAKELNWKTEAFAEFIAEMERDGVFDMVHPTKGVR